MITWYKVGMLCLLVHSIEATRTRTGGGKVYTSDELQEMKKRRDTAARQDRLASEKKVQQQAEFLSKQLQEQRKKREEKKGIHSKASKNGCLKNCFYALFCCGRIR